MKFIKKWFKQNKKALKFTLLAFVVWQILIVVIIALGARYFPTSNQYLYTEKEVVSPPWLWSRANFDGIHYLDIARKGYGVYQQAFFPLYPKLIAWLTPLFSGQALIAGWSVSLICFYFSLFFFYKLLALDFSERITKRTLLYFLVFPTAFFFSMVYTEALFFLLIIGSFYFARTKRWFWAGVFGGLASATRLPGIFLLPALLFEWWRQKPTGKIKNTRSWVVDLWPLLLIPLGLLFYMRFLAINYDDPLMFAHVQTFFGAGRTGDRIILLYQVLWRYLKMLFLVEKHSLTYFVVVLEFLTSMSFLILIIFTFLRRWYSWLVFMALAFIAPTLTGTFSSMPRYVLVLFPGFILLSLLAEKYRWFRFFYPVLSAGLLIICLILFTRGFWVA